MTDVAAARILLVEDDPATRHFLADNLCADGYEPVCAGTIAEALALCETRAPALAVLDVGLPDGSGLDLLRSVRAGDGRASRVDPRMPVIVLSGQCGEVERLRCFERGADDVVAKPFGYQELRARVAAVLRRTLDRPNRGRLEVGPLVIDPVTRGVTVDGTPLVLAQKEYALLRTLASAPTRVWTKDELMRLVWGHGAISTSRTLDSHACRLRSKLAALGENMVLNVWGVGYRLCDGDER